MVHEDSPVTQVSKETDFSDQPVELALAFGPWKLMKFDN